MPCSPSATAGSTARCRPPSCGRSSRALAQRIASFPREAIALAKRAVDAADATVREGLLEEAHLFNRTLAVPEARARMAAFLASGGQDPIAERDLGALLARTQP